ncbi:MAG TPA: hypothetical protein VNO21_13720 [Polyangiaceae bacterium]|nr:hypothetical protein [Polyangiaceae bacterium]
MSIGRRTIRALTIRHDSARLAFVAAVVAIGATSLAAQAAPPRRDEISRKESSTGVATFEVPEILFAGCSPAVRKALNDAGGVARIAEGGPHRILVSYELAPGRPDVYVDVLHKAGFPGAHLIPAT